MRAILTVVAMLGCHREADLGSTPQLFGKLANVSVHDTVDEVEAIDYRLASGTQVDDGALSYRIELDSDHRIRSAIIWSKGSIDEVTSSWGDGVVGSEHKRNARFYFDPLRRTRYEVSSTDEGFVVQAMPYRPLDEILDADEGVKVFGIDLFALAPTDVVAALDGKLLSTSRFAGPTTVVHTENNVATDAGDVGLMVEVRQDVVSYSLEFETGAFVDGSERVRALLARKWGPPHQDGHADLYRTTHASRIRVREHEGFTDIEVDR